jgi:hypothetical protein
MPRPTAVERASKSPTSARLNPRKPVSDEWYAKDSQGQVASRSPADLAMAGFAPGICWAAGCRDPILAGFKIKNYSNAT